MEKPTWKFIEKSLNYFEEIIYHRSKRNILAKNFFYLKLESRFYYFIYFEIPVSTFVESAFKLENFHLV